MVLSSVLAFARSAAQTDSNGLSDADGLIFANEANADFHRRLADKGVDAGGIVEASITAVAGTGVYNYPSNPSLLALKTMELNYGNTTAADYMTAHQIDVSNLPTGGVGWMRTNADIRDPRYDDRGNKFEIFPTPTAAHNLTAMIRMFYFIKPSVYSATTDTVLYPEDTDAAILGYRVAANYLYSLKGPDNESAANILQAKYEERVNQYSNTLGRGSQQPIQATVLQITGWEF